MPGSAPTTPSRSSRWSSAAPPASRCSTSPAARRSARSSSRSDRASSSRAPRPRSSRRSRSTRCWRSPRRRRSPSTSAPGRGAIALALATEVPHARVVARRELAARLRLDEAERPRGRRAEPAPGLRRPRRRAARTRRHRRRRGLESAVHPARRGPARPRGAAARPRARALRGRRRPGCRARRLARGAAALLRPGGTLVLEHGELQGAAIRELLAADGWRAPATTRDLLGRDRAHLGDRA